MLNLIQDLGEKLDLPEKRLTVNSSRCHVGAGVGAGFGPGVVRV